ncbi:MAG: VWA domain-containing protein [Polyangiaceae bacterium]|nr:VWA domain-containing protein [Polyangiaceae bacterium]
MIAGFIYELRARRVPVGTQEAVALARALVAGLHDTSLDGFYFIARSLLVHNEAHLDDFDLAFAKYFKGVHVEAKRVAEELIEWLKNAKKLRELTEEEKARTGGTSPFGRGGYNPSGIPVGGGTGGKGGAMQSADARKYRPYRSDLILDIRQIEVALRKLRAFTREGGEDELDIEETIAETAKNAGELEIVTRPPRRPSTRVILMMDVGGSMDPYAELVSQLFSAAKKSTHWKELRTYYFHNCVYGRVYKTDGFQEAVLVRDLMHECGKNYKLVFVGDASMAPYELLGAPGYGEEGRTEGIRWLMQLRDHFERSVWLNPDGPTLPSHPTVDAIRQIFPMFPLTLDGLGEAVAELLRGVKRAA